LWSVGVTGNFYWELKPGTFIRMSPSRFSALSGGLAGDSALAGDGASYP
jgi:hypothetical protein